MCSSLEEKLFLFSVLRVVVSFIPDFCVSSLLRGSNFQIFRYGRLVQFRKRHSVIVHCCFGSPPDSRFDLDLNSPNKDFNLCTPGMYIGAQ